MLRLYDTAEGATAPVVPESGPLRLYVCGPTVYGPPHIGHGRATLVYDVLRRYLESTGTTVRHVSNITDIDDKVIQRAAREGRRWEDLAAEEEEEWWRAMDRMGLARPHEIPRATAFVPEMIELIGELVAKDAAYAVADGVYLSVSHVPGYGLLAQQSLDSLREGARVEPVAGKHNQRDFALWKTAKPGEPSWPSPWGPGRPGWHTECVAMSLALLGDGFELHGGGSDLKFPHHENERAQAVALGRPFAAHWMHHGMVNSGGEKMARSVGNVTSLTDVLEGFDPRAYRLIVLQSHYRAPVEVTTAQLQAATQALERLDSLARRIEEVRATAPVLDGVPPGLKAEVVDRFREQMDDDLDTPQAIAGLFEAVRRANAKLAGHDSAGGLLEGSAALGCAEDVGLRTSRAGTASDAAQLLAARRDQARRDGDFAAADCLRDELVALGYRVEDTTAGTRLYR